MIQGRSICYMSFMDKKLKSQGLQRQGYECKLIHRTENNNNKNTVEKM